MSVHNISYKDHKLDNNNNVMYESLSSHHHIGIILYKHS